MMKEEKKKLKTALVLGAGGIRGLAHIGFLEVMQREGISFDMIVGCSAGALVGAFYAGGHDLKAIYDLGMEISSLVRSYKIFGIPLLRKGLFGGGFFPTTKIKDFLEKNLPVNTFEQLQIPLYIVATDLADGHLVTFSQRDLIKPLCASCAIPALFLPVEIKGKHYIDGGMATELPVSIAQKSGANRVVAVNIRPSLDFDKNMENVAKRAYVISRMHADRTEEARADLVITPKLKLKMIFGKPAEKKEIYKAGKEAAEQNLPLIRKILEVQ